MQIENSKVIMYALTKKQLKEFREGEFNHINVDFSDFELSANIKRAVTIKIDKMNSCEPTLHPWFTYWLIVDKNSLKAVGLIGFKGLKTDDVVEVGYEILEIFQGRGYASMSLNLLIKWTQKQNICKKITATRVLKVNYGSQRVLEKNNFIRTASDDRAYNYELNMVAL